MFFFLRSNATTNARIIRVGVTNGMGFFAGGLTKFLIVVYVLNSGAKAS